MPAPPDDSSDPGPSDRHLAAFVRARVAGDADAMKRAWSDLLTAEWGWVRGRIAVYRNAVLPYGRIPPEDHDDVAQDAFLRLHEWLKLEGSSMGEARSIIRQNLQWQIGDYVDRHVKEDRRRQGSLDELDAEDGGPGAFAQRAEEEISRRAPDEIERAETRTRIAEAMLTIDENKREVVDLMFRGWSANDVAERLGLSRDNVYQLNKRGMDQLRRALGDDL